MHRRGGFTGRAWGVVALAALAAGPIHGAGFSIFEQGSKALALGGAFTAQADDPSMLFYNAGGLAFVEKSSAAVGATWIRSTKADFVGANPFPGDGYKAEQKTLSQFPPHAYFVAPISSTWKFGLGIETPFGLTTEWKNPDQFAGRFLSTKAALQAFDLNPTLGWQITPSFGIGFGAIARYSKVEFNRDIPAINPFTQQAVDVGRLKLEGDYATNYGFNFGILHKYNESFSWGLSYRSAISADYDGGAHVTQILTGNPQLDAILAAQIPYNTKLPVKTTIDYPDQASLGLAFGLTRNLLLETDVNYTGWSKFKDVPIDFTGGTAANSLPDTTIVEKWKNAYSYRAGLRWTTSESSQWRFGLVYDQTPQPTEGVSPLLPDADRTGYCIGYGHTTGFKYDIGLMYLDFKERSANKSRADQGPFFGKYKTQAVLLGLTVGY